MELLEAGAYLEAAAEVEKVGISQRQGVEFLREYREHPERFLPLIDHQCKHFNEWADEDSRNMCWDAGIFQDNCPYFAECWKIFTTTVMTVYTVSKNMISEETYNEFMRRMKSGENPYFF